MNTVLFMSLLSRDKTLGANQNSTANLTLLEPVEDGRLYYDKKWYGRYQNVFVECREFGKIPAVIQSICSSDIVVKKVTDLSKIKITISQLQKGKYTLKRRC
ncbi:hypothetical protein ACHWQZ_G019225 [Mnemiopsis leidyi]